MSVGFHWLSMSPWPKRPGGPGWLARLGPRGKTPYRIGMILTFIVFVLLVAGASVAAHHSGGHGGGGGKSDAGSSGGGNSGGSAGASGNSGGSDGGGKAKVKSSANSDAPKKDVAKSKAEAPTVSEAKAKPPKSPPQGDVNAAPKGEGEAEAPAVDIEPDPEAPQRDTEPPAAEQQPAKKPQVSESEAENVQAKVEDDPAQQTPAVVETEEDKVRAATDASQDVDQTVDRTVDNSKDRARDAEPAARNGIQEPVTETIPEVEHEDIRQGIDKQPETQETPESATAEDDAPKTAGGGGRTLARDTIDKAALGSAQLPVIGLTYWVDDDMIYLLADPVPEDDNLTGQPQYRWLWPDGTVKTGGAYQTHIAMDGLEQFIVTVVRLDADGAPTHETTQWIDLTFYRSNHPGSTHNGASQDGPSEVFALGEDLRPENPKKNSDIGAAIESVPAPPLVPVIGLLGVVAWWRRRS